MRILTTSTFEKQYLKLPLRIRILANEKGVLFGKNPFDPSLQTHKLKGSMSGYWSFSVNRQYRIQFRFGEKEEVYFMAVGTHEIYF
jgi:mRNA-degrading endonuclease YafQ of YafQ-DinJ toxin-antitoxin module